MADFSKMTEGEALRSVGARPGEKDGKKGLWIPRPDKPSETMFLEASDERPECIVAFPTKWASRKDIVKGTTKRRCSKCRCKVWIAPSTQDALKKYPGTPVLCVNCAFNEIEEDKNGDVKDNATE